MVWNNMMGWTSTGCGMMGGYGITGVFYQLLILAILVLGVVWLYKQVFENKKSKR